MEQNNFKLDINPSKKGLKNIRYKLEILLIFIIAFLSICSLFTCIQLVLEMTTNSWNNPGLSGQIESAIQYLSPLFALIVAIIIKRNTDTFSEKLVKCLKFFGTFYFVIAFIIPRLPEYIPHGIMFIKYHNFVLANFSHLLIGLIFITLGYMFELSFEMKKELDEVI